MKRPYLPIPNRLPDLIKITVGAFLALCLIGYGIGYFRPGTAERIIGLFSDYVDDIGAADVDSLSLLQLIFVNNMIAAFSSMACGVVPFLYFPAFSLGANALMLGLFAAYYQNSGLGLLPYFAGTVPHGIFEASALCAACACGLWTCENLTDRLRGEEDTLPFRQSVHDTFLIFLRLIAPLLFAAAVIESFVTPQILSRFI